MRELSCTEAIREAIDQCMEMDPSIYVMGLGVPDPKGVFGTTQGLQEKYGTDRVMDMPVAENGMTGVAIGSAMVGCRPILVHQRLDFALLSLDQIINNAAKMHYMFDGKLRVPLVIRLVVGRGWGQGPQHSQSLQALFTHIPGLTVVMPSTPQNAKGLLISAIEDDSPVIFIEHRWVHGAMGQVPESMERIPLGQAAMRREGEDLTLIASSYGVMECLRAAEFLDSVGIQAGVLDLQTLVPLDKETIVREVSKTGRAVIVDGAWKTGSYAAEIMAMVTELCWDELKSPPERICFPDVPTPTSWAIAKDFYPRAVDIVKQVMKMMDVEEPDLELVASSKIPQLDAPDAHFRGPF